jgi:hypothetical protein
MEIVVDLQHAIVRVIFGKQIEWIGLPATEARQRRPCSSRRRTNWTAERRDHER